MNMDPLTPATSTLSPAISHIAETAASLAIVFQDRSSALKPQGVDPESKSVRRRQEQATVRWVLAAPTRLGALLEAGKEEEAREEWAVVQRLLEKWDGVVGVEELRDDCVKVMGGEKLDLG
jgi:vacuolar protein sorting-associated protein 51